MSPETWPAPALRARLAAPAPTLVELLEVLGEVEAAGPAARTWAVGLSANVTTTPAAAWFRRQAHLAGLGCRVVEGGLDTPLDDVRAFLAQGVEDLVLVRCFDHLLPALEARVAGFAEAERADLRAQVRAELALVLEAARPFRAVYVLRFHRLDEAPAIGPDPVGQAIAAFDAVLAEVAAGFPNAALVDAAELVAAIGRPRAFAPRFRHGHRAPYAGPFWDELARRILRAAPGATGPLKALVVDADDTLWGGVVGEVGLDGIALDPHAYPGNVYWAVQHALLGLQRTGTLLVLCSRNEAADVDEVLARHPHAVLRPGHFVIRSVDWRGKPERIAEAAAALGLGLDAMAFLDDSAFECEAVRQRLPTVRVFQVPRHAFAYPAFVADLASWFPTAGDGDRTARYQARAQALAEADRFATHADYVRSLGIRVAAHVDDPRTAARAAELSQRSNQFNLTTRRYTEAELRVAMADPDQAVYAFGVRDRFGDAGLTALLVLAFEGPRARVEAFLLSCRILGRGIERALWAPVLDDLRARGCEALAAAYLPTAKNSQVATFYDDLGLAAVARDAHGTRYAAPLAGLPGWEAPPIDVDAPSREEPARVD